MTMIDDNLGETGQIGFREITEILKRRRWTIIAPVFAAGLISCAVAFLWPALFKSQALVLIEQQAVPPQYVTPNVTSDLQARVQSMTQEVTSRTRLQGIIERFGLYPRERARLTIDEVIDKMRERVTVDPIITNPTNRNLKQELVGFQISYSAPSPRIAQEVTNELTSLFVEENLRQRTQESTSTTDFLQNQLEQTRQDLGKQEKALSDFKLRSLGSLPEQEQGNLHVLSTMEAAIRDAAAGLDRAEQQKIYLESLRDQYTAMAQSAVADTADKTYDMTLREMKNRLSQYESIYTPQHPDVVKLKEQIAQTEAQQAKDTAEAKKAVETKKSGTLLDAKTGQPLPGLAEVESRLKALNAELQTHQRDIERLQKEEKDFQARLNLTPLVEQQLAAITRNYESAKANYQSLLNKKAESELATNLEKRQQGEQFRILDSATLPILPDEPNRLAIIGIGWAIGIFLAIAITALAEMTDIKLRGEKAVARLTQIPVLVRIPVLHSPQEKLRLRYWRLAEIGVAAFLIVVSLGATVYSIMVNV